MAWFGRVGTVLATALCVGCASGYDDSPRNDSTATASVQQAINPGPAWPSCSGKCGFLSCSPIDPGACCSCDAHCNDPNRQDCCYDFATACPPNEPPSSCQSHCGGQAASGCWCDSACTGYGDCCSDYAMECSSCAGHCGGQATTGCWCDSACTGYGDCCGDYAGICVTWPKVYPQSSLSDASVLTADASSNAYLAAQIAGPWDAGGGSISMTSSQTLVVSWADSGAYRWAHVWSTPSGVVRPESIVMAPTGLYLVGWFSGGILAQDGVNVLAPPAGATTAAFLIAIDPNTGLERWARTRSGATWSMFHDIVTDSTGNVVIAGEAGSPSHGELWSYDSLATLRYGPRGSASLPPYRQLAVASDGSAYVVEAPVSGVTSYESLNPSGVITTRAELIRFGHIEDVAMHPDGGLYVAGRCDVGCTVLGDVMHDGAVVAHVPRSFVAVGTSSGFAQYSTVAVIGGVLYHALDYENGPLLWGFSSTGAPGSNGLITVVSGSTSTVSAPVTTVSGTHSIRSRGIGIVGGAIRFVAGAMDSAVVVGTGTYSTGAPVNGVVTRVP